MKPSSAGNSSQAGGSERDWWLRALAVVQSPRPVFAALRDDSPEAVEARQEPIAALVLLGGMAAFLLEPNTRHLASDADVDVISIAVIVFLAGGLSGVISYWLGGAAIHLGAKGAGVEASYRRARHVLAYAVVPLALSLLLLWPLALSVYGADLFRRGGSDTGAGGYAIAVAEIAFAAWSLGLVGVGLRVTYRLPWARVALALALSAAAFLALLVVSYGLFRGAGGG